MANIIVSLARLFFNFQSSSFILQPSIFNLQSPFLFDIASPSLLGCNSFKVIPSVVFLVTVDMVNLIAKYIRALTIYTCHKAMSVKMNSVGMMDIY